MFMFLRYVYRITDVFVTLATYGLCTYLIGLVSEVYIIYLFLSFMYVYWYMLDV